ncbi:MAG TPA: glutamine-hydrolyzing carbamoyl-phosphate synthase small subunit [Candidatus Ventricola intestinavium]|nr:glutamine-hydrolyzing carbamoyl-phosphate synthase small subunit [Candidatus Ventricola intestinavium]
MAYLILEDGSRYEGTLFGRRAPVTGEVVFTTGMTGYQETLTDPSYCGQIVCMTYPLIGNVGINDVDYESSGVRMRGFVVSELCDTPSNWQMKKTLDSYLDEQGVTGLCGVDTRALTKHVRVFGTLRGRIVAGEPTQEDFELARTHEMHDQVAQCTCPEPYEIAGDGDLTIAVMDFGLKRGILQSLNRRGCTLRVYPADTPAGVILERGCDGVMLTNGPGDPQDNPAAIAAIRELMDRVPVFGICLGHQLMALAMGGRTVQMKYGHHGANHPVKDLVRGTCAVTPQNHCFMVDPDHLPAGAVVSHVNWNDKTVEGVRYTDRRAFSVQFHPEACGGPRETSYLFDDFLTMVRESKSK